jgi:NADH dehydrogenase
VKRYLDLIARKPIVPVIGGGRGKVQPVFIADLVNAICRCIFPGRWQREATGKELEIGGGEVVSMRQLIGMLMDVTNVHKPIIHLPAPLAYAAAMYCEAFQDVPSVSRDQVKLSLRDNVCSKNALTTDLGIEPTPLRTALETYIQEEHTLAMGAES